jgi:hypothetical protein
MQRVEERNPSLTFTKDISSIQTIRRSKKISFELSSSFFRYRLVLQPLFTKLVERRIHDLHDDSTRRSKPKAIRIEEEKRANEENKESHLR